MKTGDLDILFSYGRPVAARNRKTGQAFKTSEFFSDTTFRDIKNWLGGKYVEAHEVEQETIEKIAEGAKT